MHFLISPTEVFLGRGPPRPVEIALKGFERVQLTFTQETGPVSMRSECTCLSPAEDVPPHLLGRLAFSPPLSLSLSLSLFRSDTASGDIGILLPNNQRQHHTLPNNQRQNRRMCCPTHCASYCAPCPPLLRAFSGWIRSPPPTRLGRQRSSSLLYYSQA